MGEGPVDIGNTGRALSDEEIGKYGLISYPFALDGVAVIVHPGNPITGLTAGQVREIFSGSINKWKALGGQDGVIHLFARDEASPIFRRWQTAKSPFVNSWPPDQAA